MGLVSSSGCQRVIWGRREGGGRVVWVWEGGQARRSRTDRAPLPQACLLLPFAPPSFPLIARCSGHTAC